MWVFRCGPHSCFFEEMVNNNTICLAWEDFKTDLSGYSSLNSFKELVKIERGTSNSTTVSTLSNQLDIFVNKMQIGDMVILPAENSRFYALALITSNYSYLPLNRYPHCRRIKTIIESIPKSSFPQHIQYSLGAFRTVFSAKKEDEIIRIITEDFGLQLNDKVKN